jgi:hypothetical protein
MKLLEEARAVGLKVRVEGERLVVRGPKVAEPIAKMLLAKKAEVLALLTAQQQAPSQKPQVKPRPFLPRPAGQEDNPNPWNAWTPLMLWLSEYYPEHFHAVCEAEEAIQALERSGITAGQEYEHACAELLRRFETARRLKMRANVKVWIQ